MKIDTENNNLIVFLNKFYADNINLEVKKEMETYFKQLFIKLNDVCEIDISGSFDITIYKDINYGVVLEIKKDDNDYFDYSFGQVDMRISSYSDNMIIYELDNVDLEFFNNQDYLIYQYGGKLYLKIIGIVGFTELGRVIENSRIIFGKMAKDVMRFGKIINK